MTNCRAKSQLSTSCSAEPGIRISKWAAPNVWGPDRKSRTWSRKGSPIGKARLTQASCTAPPTQPSGSAKAACS